MSVPHYTTGVWPTILIVDDYVDALAAWELLFRAKGFDVLTAASGDEALACARSREPDLIVMDLELPGRSGFQIARALKSEAGTCRIPLIAATGHSHAGELARQSGFDAVLTKPCDPAELIAEVRRLISVARTPQPASPEQ